MTTTAKDVRAFKELNRANGVVHKASSLQDQNLIRKSLRNVLICEQTHHRHNQDIYLENTDLGQFRIPADPNRIDVSSNIHQTIHDE